MSEVSEGLLVQGLAVALGAARILKDVTLSVRPGEVVGLVGPNGAGKTTTLRAISGVVRAQSGTVLIDGVDFGARPDRIAAAGIAHVPEGRGLFTNLTVRQNLRVGALAVGRRLEELDIERAVTMFPALQRFLDTRAGLLSGGEQQMAAIARGIAARPKVLMVDEMSLGLAPAIIAEMLKILVNEVRREHLGLLIVDQNVRLLAKVCDRLALLESGVLIDAEAEGEDLVRSVYFGTSRSQPTDPAPLVNQSTRPKGAAE